jgi:hypothetical protein
LTKTETRYAGNGLKVLNYIQTWHSDVKKLKMDRRTGFWNYYQIWQIEKLSTWLINSGQDFGKKFFDSNNVINVYFKPSRKNSDFLFLPLPSEHVWLKIHHLKSTRKWPFSNQISGWVRTIVLKSWYLGFENLLLLHKKGKTRKWVKKARLRLVQNQKIRSTIAEKHEVNWKLKTFCF